MFWYEDFNYYPNYSTRRLYLTEVKAPLTWRLLDTLQKAVERVCHRLTSHVGGAMGGGDGRDYPGLVHAVPELQHLA